MNREQWNQKHNVLGDTSESRKTLGVDASGINATQPPYPATSPSANCSHYDAVSCCDWAMLERPNHPDQPGHLGLNER